MSFKDKFLKVCEDVKTSAVKVKDNVQLEFKKSQLKKELDELYLTLGKTRAAEIEEHMNASEESIKLYEEIVSLRQRLAELENVESQTLVCEVCGKHSPLDAEFCPYCGTQLKINIDGEQVNE